MSLVGLSTSLLTDQLTQAQNKLIKEGTWRGVFTVNEREVPFNFELRTKASKSLENASFALINGSRRDYFVVKQIAPDLLFIKMNTYDAALVARIESDGRLTSAYKSLVPNFRGNDLPFVADWGKTYRFVEPGKDIAPTVDVSGKWKLSIISKDPTAHRVALLKQKGNKLTGVVMSMVGDTRELEGTIQAMSLLCRASPLPVRF